MPKPFHLMPTTEGGLDYVMNMTEAMDGYSGHEHTIPTYPLQPDVIKLLVESGIAYTPTLPTSPPGVQHIVCAAVASQ